MNLSDDASFDYEISKKSIHVNQWFFNKFFIIFRIYFLSQLAQSYSIFIKFLIIYLV